jgi:small subunit ribosomal protein S7
MEIKKNELNLLVDVNLISFHNTYGHEISFEGASKEIIKLFKNILMMKGKKTASEKIIRDLERSLKDNWDADVLKILTAATFNCQPLFELKSKRQGGTTIQVPFPLEYKRQRFLAIKNIVQYARKRKERTMALRLESEIILSIKGNSLSVKRKDELHKLAEVNRAFSFLRF